MTRARRTPLLACLAVGLLRSATAVGAPDPLTQAESAYERIEFGDAQRFARAALTAGGYDRGQMARIYFLLGVSAAAEGKDDEAIDAYKRLLAIDPTSKLDRGLSPKLQGPLLEARGTPPQPIACEAVFDRAKGVLHLAVHDELALTSAVLVHWRVAADGPFSEARAKSASSVDLALAGAAGAARVEYSYQLIDDHHNRLLEKGSDAAPEVAEVAPRAEAAAGDATTKRGKLPVKWLVAGIVGEVLGIGGLAGGGGAYVVGKDAADRWNNNTTCLANGMSRAANCSGDRSTAQAAANGAIAAFAVGGALVVAATVLLIAAPRERGPESVASASGKSTFDCGAGPGVVGVACGVQF